ncbi:DNA-processing protein DprA [Gudongella sp. SC589]|jgi:DNA processing protein|uniref:DNA-processing protein DprA n=1 Tax=Gudongella sp. SC589 TaxID=3385990 RepID=UPI003904A612
MSQERNTVIWLNSLGIYNDSIDKLKSYLGDLREIHELGHSDLEKLGIFSSGALEKITKSDFKSSMDRYYEKLNGLEMDVITIFDKDYPQDLLKIPDKPFVIYRKGSMIPQDHIAMGIVGSRKATNYGKWAAERFARELANMGVTIISGMAAGIDSIAHRTAVENGGRTIGILGNGLDKVYPKSNWGLYKEAVDNGALISEFPPGAQPYNFHFPMRNRIISGLSLGVIVVEAQQRSGSLITAHHALAQGKDVFAIPGNINSIYSQGTNMLIRDGAKPLLDMDDILEEVRELQLLKRSNDMDRLNEADLSDTERRVLAFLKEGPVHSDIIVLKSGLDIQTVISTLTILELKGIIKEMSSRIFAIV